MQIKAAVRPLLASYRAAAGFAGTRWDEGLAALLMPALHAYEQEARGGAQKKTKFSERLSIPPNQQK